MTTRGNGRGVAPYERLNGTLVSKDFHQLITPRIRTGDLVS